MATFFGYKFMSHNEGCSLSRLSKKSFHGSCSAPFFLLSTPVSRAYRRLFYSDPARDNSFSDSWLVDKHGWSFVFSFCYNHKHLV